MLVQVTSYLMMGALSPGLKRHSVTLFEGEKSAIAAACAASSSKDRQLYVAASAIQACYKLTAWYLCAKTVYVPCLPCMPSLMG